MPSAIVESLLSIVFPARCELCQEAVPAYPASGVCAGCRAEIRLIPGPHCVSCGRTLKTNTRQCSACHGKSFHFDRAFACAPYEGKMKELLHIYKFNGRKYLKYFFAGLLEQFVSIHLKPHAFDALASVPMDKHKKNSRGFNQSELLSAELGSRTGLPDLSAALARKKSPHPQHLMAKAAREQNVKGSFTVKHKPDISMKNILLVDDILTTGQTASECARTMKEAGASSVTVLACARGI